MQTIRAAAEGSACSLENTGELDSSTAHTAVNLPHSVALHFRRRMKSFSLLLSHLVASQRAFFSRSTALLSSIVSFLHKYTIYS
jgi:hypothetical protein